MDKNEYNRICQCKSAKEIWRLLEITHEGTNQVKESETNLLVHNYEFFSMKETETIVEMITRFIDIVNGLKALGKTYKEPEKVMKILRYWPYFSIAPKYLAFLRSNSGQEKLEKESLRFL